MELHEVKVTGTARVLYPKQDELVIVPITDVQYGADGCAVGALREHIEWGLENGAYWLGLGEFGDFASPSSRRRLAEANANLYESVEKGIAAGIRQQTQEIIQLFRPTQGRWIGQLEGHHYFEFPPEDESGITKTTDQLIAEALDAPFLGTCAMIHVRFPNGQVLKIWAHHGGGSGQTLGAPLLRLERVASRWDAHIYVMGHQHKSVASPIPWLFAHHDGERMVVVEQRKVVACCGGFLKGYEQGTRYHGRPRGTYVERAMLPPTSVGGLLFRIRPTTVEGAPVFDIRVEF